MSATPYLPHCPKCAHEFSLFELRRMAIGDNWDRPIWIEDDEGKKRLVSFDQIDPKRMTPLLRPPSIEERDNALSKDRDQMDSE